MGLLVRRRRAVSVKLDNMPHFDTRFGMADFNGDGRLDLAGFGRSPAGASGVYLRQYDLTGTISDV